MIRPLLVAISIALLSLFLGACGGRAQEAATPPVPTATPAGPATAVLSQKDQGQGGVTVEAIWVTAAHAKADDIASKIEQYPLSRYVAFHLKLDTHSGDLGRYDLAKAASLAADGGAPQPATAWVSLSDDSHHREGLLIFPRPQGAQVAELVLRQIGDVPQRALRWEAIPKD